MHIAKAISSIFYTTYTIVTPATYIHHVWQFLLHDSAVATTACTYHIQHIVSHDPCSKSLLCVYAPYSTLCHMPYWPHPGLHPVREGVK